ncbi:VWA domain-containing protein, partial [Lysobacter maris]
MTLPDLSTLHLLRPDWLWALSLLPVLAAVWALRRRRDGVWREAVDAHLLPHLLDRGDRPRRRWTRGLGALAGMLAYAFAVLAMTGPSWRQVEQPLWQGKLPLVMALDLSSAGMAADPPPSRVAQARAKLGALLAARDGPVGLLVYADDAFTVAPITDDAANVALFLDALSPDIMPVDGQRADRALAAAVRLMQQAGFEKGRILLLAGEADERAVEAAGAARAA